MAGNLLRKWLGQPQPLPGPVTSAIDELDRLARDRPAQAQPLLTLRDLLPVLFGESMSIEFPSLTPELARLKRARGLPLLRGETPVLDRDAFRQRFRRMAGILERHAGEPASRLARAVANNALDPSALLQHVLAGAAQEVHLAAERVSCDPELTAAVLRLSVFPLLSRVERREEETGWTHGYCPTCGSWPLLGELRGLEQILYLRCGWCASGWEFPRLCCPYCGTRDHEALGYLHTEGREESERAACCDRCHGYVKIVTTLSALAPVDLLLADVKTLFPDLIAAGHGFQGRAEDDS